jgi:hypothetical protein
VAVNATCPSGLKESRIGRIRKESSGKIKKRGPPKWFFLYPEHPQANMPGLKRI